MAFKNKKFIDISNSWFFWTKYFKKGVLKCIVCVDRMIIYFDVPAKSLPMDESAAGLLDNTDIICHKNFFLASGDTKKIHQDP